MRSLSRDDSKDKEEGKESIEENIEGMNYDELRDLDTIINFTITAAFSKYLEDKSALNDLKLL
jgi:hypothetical protein